MVTRCNNDRKLDFHSNRGIISLQRLEKGKYKDLGDFTCIVFFEKNTDKISWIEIPNCEGGILKEDRIIFDRGIYIIENIFENSIKVKKDEIESSLLKFEDMGITIEKGIQVPVNNSMTPQDVYFVNQWVGIWARNICENYKLLQNGKSLKNLKDVCKEGVAVIVGAGPSLDKNIVQLKDINAVIIATDRAYKPLLNAGIEPDLIISIDCHDNHILGYLDKVDSSNHTLILNSASDYKIARQWKGNILYFNMAHTGMQFCEKILPFLFPNLVAIANVGCVVNTAVIISDLIGCKDIVLVGCDFSYPEQKMACDEYDWIDGKFQKVEVDNKERFEKRSAKIKKNGIYTYPPFLDYEKTMKHLESLQKLRIINATEGGIIDKFPAMTLKDVKEKYRCKNVFKKILRQEANK